MSRVRDHGDTDGDELSDEPEIGDTTYVEDSVRVLQEAATMKRSGAGRQMILDYYDRRDHMSIKSFPLTQGDWHRRREILRRRGRAT